MSKKIDIYKNPMKKLNIENPKKVSVIIPNYNYDNSKIADRNDYGG